MKKSPNKIRAQIPCSVSELCTAFNNENAHTEYVTRLALFLFDHFSKSVGLRRKSRPLLRTAALLHDIGYSVAPNSHGLEGAKIVLRSKIRGLGQNQLSLVAAIILLHQNPWKSRLRNSIFSSLALNERALALKLAGLLRIADGLDHRHDQQTSIVSASAGNKAASLIVHGDSAGKNIPYAIAKADLWQETTGQRLSISATAHKEIQAMNIDESAACALRRRLSPLLRDIRQSATDSIAHHDPEHVHRLRGAIRRFRSLLRLGSPIMASTSAAKVSKSLGMLNDRLGRIRDDDIVWKILSQTTGSLTLSSSEQKTGRLRRIIRVLNQSDFEKIMRMASLLVRAELSRLEECGEKLSASELVSKRLRKLLKRVPKQQPFNKGIGPDELHRIRKLCRRGRFWTEYFSHHLSPHAKQLACCFKNATDALGKLRDIEIVVRRSKRLGLNKKAIARLKCSEGELREKAKREWGRLLGQIRLSRRSLSA